MKINLTPIELIDQLRSWFHPKDRVVTLSDDQWIDSKRVAWETAVSKNLTLPGLVGFWPMSSVQRSTGNAYDLSGQGRTLTYNGNPAYNIYNGFAPYIDFDGTGDYLSRADETDLDILGTETIYNSSVRGLTMGGWFWVDIVTTHGLIGKFNANGWLLSLNATNSPAMTSDAGTYTHSGVMSINRWYFVASRFVPSASIDVYLDGDKESLTVGVGASLPNNAHTFLIGAINGGAGQQLNGRASLCFLCANALSDDLILAKYYQERELFQ